jgi:hypothetical protein
VAGLGPARLNHPFPNSKLRTPNSKPVTHNSLVNGIYLEFFILNLEFIWLLEIGVWLLFGHWLLIPGVSPANPFYDFFPMTCCW